MSPMVGNVIFTVVEIVLILLFFFLACSCTTGIRREARENEQQGHNHPRAPSVAVAPPRRHHQYAPRNEERLRAPVVLAHFPYAARARAAASEPPPACAICLDELRQGQLGSEVPACRHIFHEGCIRVWAKSKNSCPLCRARLVLPGAAYGVAPADDMV